MKVGPPEKPSDCKVPKLPMHNLLLKSISKEPVIVVQVNVRS